MIALSESLAPSAMPGFFYALFQVVAVATELRLKVTNPVAKAEHEEHNMASSQTTLSQDEFCSHYLPIEVRGQEGLILHELAEVRHANPKRVWTVVSRPDGMRIEPGLQIVESIGFVLTKRPWLNGEKDARYTEN